MKFLIDRCAGHRLAVWLREQGHDVVESKDRGPDPGDRTVLEWAVGEDRVLVTMDKDFGEFIFFENLPHYGLVRLPDVPVERRIQLMRKILSSHHQDLKVQAIVTVQGERIRISRAVE